MELDYDYIAKLVRKTQEGDSDANSRQTVRSINAYRRF